MANREFTKLLELKIELLDLKKAALAAEKSRDAADILIANHRVGVAELKIAQQERIIKSCQ